MNSERTELKEIKKNTTGTGLLIENDGHICLSDTPNNKKIYEAYNNGDGWRVPNPFIVDAVFQKFDIKNANGRIYPEDVLKRQVAEYQQKINEHRAYGECNHPSESTIDLGRISHNIIELHWEGHTLVGKMELNISEGYRRSGICSTLGDTAANLLLNGYKIGVSSRGVGSVEQKLGQYIVGDDFELICWDLVSDPSTPNAWLGRDQDELRPYIESDQTTSKKNSLNEKISKIKGLL